jgi:hypothetical protein
MTTHENFGKRASMIPTQGGSSQTSLRRRA